VPGYLVLESGEIFEGQWHGGAAKAFERAGEVVFNTSHSGYEEIATDPSYFSQIVVMTAPMQGNYGAEAAAWESCQIWIEGFVCLQMQNSERNHSWLDKLNQANVPILSEVDTRAITIRLRSGGTPWGAIVNAESSQDAKLKALELIQQKKKIDQDWVGLVSRKNKEIIPGKNPKGPRLAVLDFGSKENILRELAAQAKELVVFPSRASLQQIIEEKVDAIMLTNGPGDPSSVQVATGTVRELLGVKPIFGICMGHQILALALGAKTYKLKFGHRGSNHPIKDELLGKVYMTSQNHGYAVEAHSLPNDVKVTQVNLNDNTVAGILSEKRNCLGIQYHPESHPGPHEARALFDYFFNVMIPRGC
jgi:carbamoyl-phosphate synthase small subunit